MNCIQIPPYSPFCIPKAANGPKVPLFKADIFEIGKAGSKGI